MRLVFTPTGWADYTYWQATDKLVLKRLNRLLDETLRTPESGIGKPERLKHEVVGAWSRRINEQHRLVYLVREEDVIVLQARYHY